MNNRGCVEKFSWNKYSVADNEGMKVSVICPTFNRHERHKNLYAAFSQQSYRECELLVLDDSREASPSFLALKNPRVQYLHSTTRESVGVKRNRLVEIATGDIIAHFDDDDY